MPTKRTLLVTALLALLVTTAGCSSLMGDGTDAPGAAAETPSDDVDAEQVLNRTAEGMTDLETFTFDARMSMATQQAAQPTNMTATGAIDVAAGEARAEIEAPTDTITVYFVNETMYMKMQGTWIKQDIGNVSENATAMPPGDATAMPPGNATAQPTVTPQPGLFENATSISFEGNTTIDGTDVYEIDVDVDAEQIMNATGQQGMAQTAAAENVSGTVYVTHGDYRLKRVDADMTATVQGQEADVDVRITLDDFNEDVTIDLPDAARNAQSMAMG